MYVYIFIFSITVQQHLHLKGFKEAFINLPCVSLHIATIQQSCISFVLLISMRALIKFNIIVKENDSIKR